MATTGQVEVKETWTPPVREAADVNDGNRTSLTIAFIRLLMGALAPKSMEWAAMLGGVGVWAYALTHVDWLHIACALGYSVAIYLPLVLKKR
jgi:hypothetical protein